MRPIIQISYMQDKVRQRGLPVHSRKVKEAYWLFSVKIVLPWGGANRSNARANRSNARAQPELGGGPTAGSLLALIIDRCLVVLIKIADCPLEGVQHQIIAGRGQMKNPFILGYVERVNAIVPYKAQALRVEHTAHLAVDLPPLPICRRLITDPVLVKPSGEHLREYNDGVGQSLVAEFYSIRVLVMHAHTTSGVKIVRS